MGSGPDTDTSVSMPSISRAGAPVPLLLTHPPLAVDHIDGQEYVVSPDGQRFLVNIVAQENTPPITLILNWKTLQKRIPKARRS